jgi:hypothetical protein
MNKKIRFLWLLQTGHIAVLKDVRGNYMAATSEVYAWFKIDTVLIRL